MERRQLPEPPEASEPSTRAYDDQRLQSAIYRAVTEALEHHDREHRHPILDTILLISVLWILFLSSSYFSYAPWINRLRYSLWYHVDRSQIVQYEDKPPSDCDFLESPVGDKGCHYQKHVELDAPPVGTQGKPTVVIYWNKEQGNY